MKNYLFLSLVLFSCSITAIPEKKNSTPDGIFYVVSGLNDDETVVITGANIGKYTKRHPERLKKPALYAIYDKHAQPLIGQEISDDRVTVNKLVTYLEIQIDKKFFKVKFPKDVPDNAILYLQIKKTKKKKDESNGNGITDTKKKKIEYVLATKKDTTDNKKKPQKKITITLKKIKKKKKKFGLPEIMPPTFALPKQKIPDEIDLS